MEELKNIFNKIAEENHWGDADSLSGSGSNLVQTATIRQEIPKLLRQYHIKTMLDAPCGDFFWMRTIQAELDQQLQQYYGGDIVEKLIARNQKEFGSHKTAFLPLDITKHVAPTVDLIFTRDCLVHLSFENIYQVIRQYKHSKSKYLLTTTFTRQTPNKDIKDGDWRTLNLQLAPFFFPKPLLLINENCTEGDGNYGDKCLGLWEIDKLPNFTRWSIFYTNFLDRWKQKM